MNKSLNNRKKRRISLEDIESLLYDVDKPGRYIGGEINSTEKDIDKCDIAIALCYPDIYEIGTSNLAIKLLSDIINAQNGMVAERVFSPWLDMEEKLRMSHIPYFSLESKTLIADFDILGFSVAYELLYTNMLNILELSGIPIYSYDRSDNDPLIIAGGPSVVNPEPIADFMDAIVIGEGETLIIEIAEAVRYAKKEQLTKTELLKKLSLLSGVYVPSLTDCNNNKNSLHKIERYRHSEIEVLHSPTKMIIPNVKSVQDRGVVEVSRGCTCGCRFCQAGMTYRPVRERSVDTITDIVEKIIKESAHYEISLMSLSIADYTNLPILLDRLFERFKDRGVSFSLPSLRIDSFSFEIAKKMAETKKFGLTLAVESGNDYMRSIINKRYTEDKLLQIIKDASEYGWNTIKLYFMIGLPVETGKQTEEEAITDLLNKIAQKTSRRIQINANIGIFIPKPHTPFQWVKMIKPDEAREKIRYIKGNVKSRRIKIKYVEPELSLLEGLLSLSGRDISGVIYKSFKDGARFDGWNECFSIERWVKFCEEENINIDDILYKDKYRNYNFPWNHINVHIDNEFLYNEYLKSQKGVTIEDCRKGCYENCGSCKNGINRDFDKTHKSIDNESIDKINRKFLKDKEQQNEIAQNKPEYLDKESIGKIRLIFEKTEFSKFISHLDMNYMMLKLIFLADIPIMFSKGYNPTPKLEFTPPLPVGVESNYEIMEFKIHKEINLDKIIEMLNQNTIKGTKFKGIKFINDNISLGKKIESFEYSVLTENLDYLEKLKNYLLNIENNEYIITIKGKNKLNTLIRWSLEDKKFNILIKNSQKASISIMDIIESALSIDRRSIKDLKIVREKINLLGD